MKKLIPLICLLLLIPFTSLAGPPSPKFVDNTAYNATSWNGVKHKAPSKDAVRDKIETMVVLEADVILESYLKSVDSPADEDFLTYESTTGDFEWHSAADVADTIAGAISAGTLLYSQLDTFTESNLYALLTDVTQFYEVGDEAAILLAGFGAAHDTYGELDALYL